MDQVDAILRLKNCYKELEEIDKNGVHRDVARTKQLVAEKMHDIAEVLNVDVFIPKEDKPNVPKPEGPIIHKIHNHPTLEESIPLASDRVIIDREVFDQLLKNWDQIEKYLIQTAIII